jgi:hypothetical protein
MTQLARIARSFITTYLGTFLALVPLEALASGSVDWVAQAALAALVGALRTVLAILDPGQTYYGINATPDTPKIPEGPQDTV